MQKITLPPTVDDAAALSSTFMAIMDLAHRCEIDHLGAGLDTLSVARTFRRIFSEPHFALRDARGWIRMAVEHEESLAIDRMPALPCGIDPWDWRPEPVYSNRALKRLEELGRLERELVAAETTLRAAVYHQEGDALRERT